MVQKHTEAQAFLETLRSGQPVQISPVFAFGEEGPIVHWDGKGWTQTDQSGEASA